MASPAHRARRADPRTADVATPTPAPLTAVVKFQASTAVHRQAASSRRQARDPAAASDRFQILKCRGWENGLFGNTHRR